MHVCAYVNDPGLLVLRACISWSCKTSFLSLPHPMGEKKSQHWGWVSGLRNPAVFYCVCAEICRERKKRERLEQNVRAWLGNDEGILSFLLTGNHVGAYLSPESLHLAAMSRSLTRSRELGRAPRVSLALTRCSSSADTSAATACFTF